MATVIDALVVTLGLNAQNFLQGNREANQSLDRTRTNTRTLTAEEEKREKLNARNRTTRDRDHNKQKTQQRENIEGLKELTKASLSFFGTATTLGGMATFIGGITQANSQLYRTATNLGTNTESLTAWGGAIEQAGGNAQEAINTMGMLSRSMTEMLVTGNTATLPYFRQMNIDLEGIARSANPLPNLLKAINSAAQNNVGKVGRTHTFNLLQMMGLDYGVADVLVGTTNDMDALLKKVEKLGLLNMDNARNSRELARQWTELRQRGVALGRDVEAVTTPAITQMLNKLMDFSTENPKITTAIAGVALAFLTKFAPVRALLYGVGGILAIDDWQTWQEKGESVIGKLAESFNKLYESGKRAWYASQGDFTQESQKEKEKMIEESIQYGIYTAISRIFNVLQKTNVAVLGGKFGTTTSKGQSDVGIRKTGKKEDLLNENTHRFTPKGLMKDLIKKGYSQDEAQALVDDFTEQAGLDNRGRINTQINLASKIEELANARLNAKQYPTKENKDLLKRLESAQAARQLAGQAQSTNNATSTNTNSTTVGQVNVYTQATDAQGIARELPRAIANQAESGSF